eukprot:GHVU01048718.1.p2 GENE.GHVU01048718.1~~GHVU01048718.1.p2  ORF type:complete len:198 (-),score=13.52 GHVU01048718.1:827-1420(-)
MCPCLSFCSRSGRCLRGDACRKAHGEEELRRNLNESNEREARNRSGCRQSQKLVVESTCKQRSNFDAQLAGGRHNHVQSGRANHGTPMRYGNNMPGGAADDTYGSHGIPDSRSEAEGVYMLVPTPLQAEKSLGHESGQTFHRDSEGKCIAAPNLPFQEPPAGNAYFDDGCVSSPDMAPNFPAPPNYLVPPEIATIWQ